MLTRSTARRLAALGAALAAASLTGSEARGAGGKVIVKSDPPGANVYLDNEDDPRGVTPLDIEIASGLHKVRVSLAGYAIQTRGFYLAPGGERQFDFTLTEGGGDEPAPAAPRAKPEPRPVRRPEREPEPEPAAEEEKAPKTIDVECPVCRGSRAMDRMGCATCRGTGYIDLNQCDKCGGSRRVDYPCPGCRGEGKLVAGGTEKECRYCKGQGKFPCPPCKGSGTIRRPNPEAAGYPTTDCPVCSGSGFLQEAQCTFCGGRGDMWIGSSTSTGNTARPGGGGLGGNTGTNLNRQKVPCPYCNGEGKGKPLCRRCQGRAFQGSGRNLRPCETCYGTGYSFIPCAACRGCGWVRSRE